MTITPVARPMLLVATTGPLSTGVALQNGTPTFLTWNVPNDGLLHRFNIFSQVDVTVAETGGQIVAIWTAPDGTASGSGITLVAGGHAVGLYQGQAVGFAQPGSTVTVHQQTALTVGTAVGWHDIWAS